MGLVEPSNIEPLLPAAFGALSRLLEQGSPLWNSKEDSR